MARRSKRRKGRVSGTRKKSGGSGLGKSFGEVYESAVTAEARASCALDNDPSCCTQSDLTEADLNKLIRKQYYRDMSATEVATWENIRSYHDAKIAELDDANKAKQDSTEALLAERGRTHGSFEDNARISQSLKDLFRRESRWDALDLEAREALDMFATKICRILSTGGGIADDWKDIGGYARIVEKTFGEDAE